MRTAVSGAIDAYMPAAQMVVALLDHNPHAREEFIKRGTPRQLIDDLERLGRGQMIPSLMFTTSTGARLAKRLPTSEQQIVIKDGVEVAEPNAKTDKEHRVIKIEELTPSQAQQVFCGDRRRSLAEQRTYIAAKQSKAMPINGARQVEFTKDGVTIRTPAKFTWDEVALWQTHRK